MNFPQHSETEATNIKLDGFKSVVQMKYFTSGSKTLSHWAISTG